MAFRFEKLEVWQRALNYYVKICEVSQNFPTSEIWGLRSQLREATLSISLNIAEGCGRRTKVEFKRFIDIARGSLFESVSNLFACKARNLVSASTFNELYCEGEEISKMLAGLRS